MCRFSEARSWKIPASSDQVLTSTARAVLMNLLDYQLTR